MNDMSGPEAAFGRRTTWTGGRRVGPPDGGSAGAQTLLMPPGCHSQGPRALGRGDRRGGKARGARPAGPGGAQRVYRKEGAGQVPRADELQLGPPWGCARTPGRRGPGRALGAEVGLGRDQPLSEPRALCGGTPPPGGQRLLLRRPAPRSFVLLTSHPNFLKQIRVSPALLLGVNSYKFSEGRVANIYQN